MKNLHSNICVFLETLLSSYCTSRGRRLRPFGASVAVAIAVAVGEVVGFMNPTQPSWKDGSKSPRVVVDVVTSRRVANKEIAACSSSSPSSDGKKTKPPFFVVALVGKKEGRPVVVAMVAVDNVAAAADKPATDSIAG